MEGYVDFSNRRVENARRAIAVVATAVTLYYLYWRYTGTFNLRALFFSWSLFLAEAFGALSAFLFYFTVWRLRQRTPLPPLSGRTVDVFIPTKNETVVILRKTLLACNDLRYPHRTLVLDDGNRPEVKALCEELGCVYHARKSGEHAKAGNLNYGLAQSDAEFIAIFDADHIPLPNFIDRTIGYFVDEKVGFVQTPQEFYNIDSIQHRSNAKTRKIWAEQYLFFSVIQPGRDAWNAAYFVGSCALIRRKTLDDIGGFATGSVTEDMHTSIKIHARGWSSVYHNENLALGIAAETLEPFSIQRQRWGVGNWQVFVRANPLFIRGLTLPQRICYLSSMIYPLEGLQKAVFYITPPIALFLDVLPMRALDISYLAHFIPYFLISTYGFNEMARGVGGHILLEQYSMAKYFMYLKTMIIPFIPKKSKVFSVTPKGKRKSISKMLIIPQYAVILLSLTSITWGLAELLLNLRYDSFIVSVNSFWALYNSGLALTIVSFDYRKLFQRRVEYRMLDSVVTYYRDIGFVDHRREEIAVAINITEDGIAMIMVDKDPACNEFEVDLMLPLKTVRVKCRVVRERTINIDQHSFSEVGMHFIDIAATDKDFLSRYLYSSAVLKLMRDYSHGYQTYIERHFGNRTNLQARAARTLTYFPVEVALDSNGKYPGVIKDVSETGLLLEINRRFISGQELTVEVVVGKRRFALKGYVARDHLHARDIFPVFLVGIQFDKNASSEVENLMNIAHRMEDFILQ